MILRLLTAKWTSSYAIELSEKHVARALYYTSADLRLILSRIGSGRSNLRLSSIRVSVDFYIHFVAIILSFPSSGLSHELDEMSKSKRTWTGDASFSPNLNSFQ